MAAVQSVASAIKIGVIGVGMVGGPLSSLWAQAGHEVLVSSRNPSSLTAPEPNGRVGTPEEAAAFGDVVLLAIPFSATASLSAACKAAMDGKVVIDANNAFPHRDGDAAVEALGSGAGSGSWTAAQLPSGCRVVKAFNTWPFFRMAVNPGRAGQPCVPVASDDDGALQLVAKLVADAGLDAVPLTGLGLKASAHFDAGTPIGPNSGVVEAQVRAHLGLPPPEGSSGEGGEL
jgi:predicted dinucleotide-binding enzyme